MTAPEQSPLGDDGIRFESGQYVSLQDLAVQIGEQIAEKKSIGLLSISVLQDREDGSSRSWQAYDRILREISRFLVTFSRKRLRRTDDMFSLSVNGNSFVVLLDPPRDGRALKTLDIAKVRMRLRKHLQAHLDHCVANDMAADFGCYVGGTTMLHQEGVPVERILNRALEESFADALQEKNREEKEYLLGLTKIMESELIRSVYQPVVDIYERRTIGFEALTRVIGGRFSNPETLFRTAHQNNVLWNLERLCRRKALDGLPALAADQLLFLNIEPDSIHDPELLDTTFSERLEKVGLAPEQIVLEMTERSAIRDFAAIRRTSEKFRELGFRLAMDDVGSGYSGLQAIAEISPDFLKVDMSLVRDLHANPIKRELVNTIRKFADATGISLVAEGVETHEELEALLETGVRFAQGFLLAPPSEVPASPDWRLIPKQKLS